MIHQRKKAWHLSISGIALMSSLIVAAPVAAQESGQAIAKPDSDVAEQTQSKTAPRAGKDTVGTDEIVVTGTGTNISGVKAVGSASITIDRSAIEATGLTSAADVVNTLPQVRNLGIFREGGTVQSDNAQQGSTINLRGLGQGATLILVNGHRLVPTGANSAFTDANQVPLPAIERIDVITDGASAIYGSDAIAGVVNYVMRKDYDGLELNFRASNASGGAEITPSVTFGKTWEITGLGAGNFLVSYEHTARKPWLNANSPYLLQDLRSVGGPDRRLSGNSATAGNPGNIVVRDPAGARNATLPRAGAYVYYGLPQGGNVGLTATNLLLNQPNLADSAYATDYTGRIRRDQVAVYFNQDLNDWLSIFGEGSYSNRETVVRSINTENITLNLSPLLVDANGVATTTRNPYYISGVPNVAPGTALQVQYNAFKDIGPASFVVGVKSYNVTAGGRARLPFDWNGEAYFTFGRDRACNFCQPTNSVNSAALQRQIDLGNINPLSSNPLSAAHIATFTGSNLQKSGNGFNDFVVKFDGPLFRLPGGLVRAAFGGERSSMYNFNVNTANRGITNATVTDTDEASSRGSRNVLSAFAELYVPLVEAGMNVPLVQQLKLDVAVRYDRYSDVGETTNPKLGLSWVVNDALQLRASWGTSFRAPTLPDLNPSAASFAFGFPGTNNDPRVKNGFLDLPTLKLANVVVLGGANPDLRPEKATNWSVGGDLEIGKGFKMSATYYNIRYSNQIASPNVTGQYFSNSYPNYNGYAKFIVPINNPATCSNSNISSADPVLQPHLQRGALYFGGLTNFCALNVLLDQRQINLATTKQSGIDAQVGYKGDLGEFGVNVSAAINRVLNNDVQVIQGGVFNDQLGFYGTPIKLRGRGQAGFSWRGFNTDIFLNYTGSYTNNQAIDALGNSTAPVKVKPYTTFDLNLSYGTDSDATRSGWIKGLRASLTIQNLFDRDPPLALTGGGAFNGAYSNPFGRTFTAQFSAKF